MLLRTLAYFLIQLAGTSVENRKRAVERGLQSRPGRQQLPWRAGSFPIRVSETQEEKAIVHRDSRELGFITYRYRHRPTRTVIPLFPGWYDGKNKGNTILEQKLGQKSSSSGEPRKKSTQPWTDVTKETSRIDRRHTVIQETEAGKR